MNDIQALAAIVQKANADVAIELAKQEGCYDSERRIRSHGPETLEIPVTAHPKEFDPVGVCTQSAPDWRVNTLDDRLRIAGFSADERAAVPNSWAIIGEVIVGSFATCPRPARVGRELLDLHGQTHTVVSIDAINGPHREPKTSIVAGAGETETIHTEHGTKYALDVARVMFSPGNKAERKRMGEVVDPNEMVFDMFAGIGYFTLPMARAGATIVATERNPFAARFLAENVALNAVGDRVTWYRNDCRAIRPRADRIVMGYYDAPEYLDTALIAIRPGGIIHLHAVVPNKDRWGELSTVIDESRAPAETEIISRRVVKSHSPGMDHVVCDIRIPETETKAAN